MPLRARRTIQLYEGHDRDPKRAWAFSEWIREIRERRRAVPLAVILRPIRAYHLLKPDRVAEIPFGEGAPTVFRAASQREVEGKGPPTFSLG